MLFPRDRDLRRLHGRERNGRVKIVTGTRRAGKSSSALTPRSWSDAREAWAADVVTDLLTVSSVGGDRLEPIARWAAETR